jgi:hypothetical protein
MVNSSRSLQALGEQSSVYIPMSNSPIKSPSYLSIDATSRWHVGALQVIGLESMTISSRLRTSVGGRGTLQDIEDTINSTGKRRIAKFEMSIADPDVLSDNACEENAQAEKTGSMTSRHTSEGDEELSKFDLDVFTRDYRVATPRLSKKEHVFGRAEVSRGNWSLSDESEPCDPHDRFNQGPSLQRYVNRPLHFQRASEYEAAMHSAFLVMPLHTVYDVARHHSPILLLVCEALTVLTLPGLLRPSSFRYWTAIRHRYLTLAQDKLRSSPSTPGSPRAPRLQVRYAQLSKLSSDWSASRREKRSATGCRSWQKNTMRVGIAVRTATTTARGCCSSLGA